jgi:hypothetical protein
MLPIVTVPPPPVRGHYARHVLETGHRPGVLSGAEIHGRARMYAGWYSDVRRRVAEFAAAHGVRSSLVLHPRRKRLVRVWTDETGARVRVVVRGHDAE